LPDYVRYSTYIAGSAKAGLLIQHIVFVSADQRVTLAGDLAQPTDAVDGALFAAVGTGRLFAAQGRSPLPAR
jgi:hypothetical protein